MADFQHMLGLQCNFVLMAYVYSAVDSHMIHTDMEIEHLKCFILFILRLKVLHSNYNVLQITCVNDIL